MRRAGRSWLGPLAMILQSLAYNGLPVVVLFMITGFLTSPFPALMSIFEQVCFWVFRLTLILSGQYHGEATADDAWTPIFQNGGSMLMLYVITWLCWTIPVFIVVMVGNVMAGNGVGRGFVRWAYAIAVVPRGWDRLARKCFGGVFRLQFKIICVLFPALVALSIIFVIYSMFPVVRWGNQYGGGVLSGVGGWGVVIAIVLMTVVFILYLVIMFAWAMTTLPMAPFCIAYGLAMLQLFIQANADALARVNEDLGAFRDINPAWMIPFLLILLPAPCSCGCPGHCAITPMSMPSIWDSRHSPRSRWLRTRRIRAIRRSGRSRPGRLDADGSAAVEAEPERESRSASTAWTMAEPALRPFGAGIVIRDAECCLDCRMNEYSSSCRRTVS